MPRRLDASSPDFQAQFAELLGLKRETSVDVNDAARAILEDVRTRGDAAVLAYTAQFDRVEYTPDSVRVTPEEIMSAREAVSSEDLQALELAAKRIKAFAEKQLPEDFELTDEIGTKLGARWTPVDAAGIYVPGGLAAYPSSVLMNAIPARVAGVERIAMVVPTPDGELSPMVLAAASTAGVGEIYKIGGAQAVAALAYGTESIAPVDVIVGPGNAYVAAAKRQVYGTVGIDMIAGPSEILVVADGQNDPAWIAADLLSQAEHDTAAQSILITDDVGFGDAVAAAVEAHLATLDRAEIARESWEANGAVITVATLDDALPLIDALAPEHLELAVDAPRALADRVRHAGAIFLGRFTPEAIGDYIAGPNHVLPTARSARFASGLSVLDFMKRSSIVECTAEALGEIGPAAAHLADREGLGAHALSVRIRMNK